MPDDNEAPIETGTVAGNAGASFTVNDPQVHNLIQGQKVELHTHQASPARMHSFDDGPLCIGRIPVLAAARQERPADSALADALADGPTAVVCQVLSGMGGVGKSQIAAAYARKRWDAGELDLLVWVNAASREGITAAFAEVGVAVCGSDASDSDRAAREFLNWLDRPNVPKWLVILDDLTDLAHLADLWPPEAAHGLTVLTTRIRNAALEGARRTRVDVELFTAAEAEAFLEQRLGHNPRLLEGTGELAEDLGFLPLALAQAAAFILDQPGLTCADYRQLLADRTVALADLSPEAIPDGYPRSVTAALHLSVEAADQYQPRGLATELLKLTSLLDPAGIPADLFDSESAIEALTVDIEADAEDGQDGSPLTWWRVKRLLGKLHQLSLVDFDGGTIQVHALVQRVVLDGLESDERDWFAVTAADALLEIWPEPENDPGRSAALRANADRLREHARSALYEADAHPVLFSAGTSFGESGQVKEAADYFRSLAAECVEFLGSDHPDTLTARHELARFQGVAGDAAGAAAALKALVADRLRVLGPDHPHTLTARHSLTYWQAETGDTSGAAAALEALLTDSLRVRGPDHPYTLTARHDLANLQGETGDKAGAAAAYEALLVDRLRVLGSDAPEVFSTRGNLAHWHGEAGDVTAAVAMLEALLADRLRVLGPDHPDTLGTRHNLASWQWETGDAVEAAAALETLLADRLRVLGPDHPDTLGTRHNLADWQGRAGDPAKAAAAYEDLLADSLRVLGPDHPQTLAARNNLAHWRVRAGDTAGTAAAFESLLADRLRVLGPDHLDTFNTRYDIARWQGETGDPAGAVAAIEELLADLLRVYGPDHRNTLSTRHHLAYWHGMEGDAATAAATSEELVPDLVRVLGPDHSLTLTTRHNLATFRGEAGDEARAASAFGDLLTDLERVLGPDHPDTLTAREDLAYWRQRAGLEE